MERESDTALLSVGHGSTVNPDSSGPTLAHAAEIRRRNIFGDVQCAFWKEEPSLRDAVFLFDPGTIKKVYVAAGRVYWADPSTGALISDTHATPDTPVGPDSAAAEPDGGATKLGAVRP